MAEFKINNVNASEAGLIVVSVTRGMPWEDEAVLEATGDVAAAGAFGYHDAVTIKHPDGTVILRGKVYGLPREAGGAEQARTYRVRGVWAELERTVYCQAAGFVHPDLAGDPDIESDWTSIVWLGGDTVAAWSAVITFAASAAGVSIALGSVPTGYEVPPQEYRDIAVSEALQRLLARHPEAVPWVDYSPLTPVLNLTPAADLDEFNLELANDPVSGLSVNPRHDLRPEKIVILWTRANKYPGGAMRLERRMEICDGDGLRVVNPDETPGEPVLGPGILRYTLDVAPGESTASPHQQDMRTRDLPAADASESNKAKFLRKNIPWLAALKEAGEISDGDLKVTGYALAVQPHPPDDNDDPDGVVAADWDMDIVHYPRQAIEGFGPEWMRKLGLHFAPVDVTAFVSLKTPTQRLALAKHFGPLGNEVVEIRLTVTGTSATTRRYQGLPGWTAPQAWPAEGLAEKLWQNAEALRFDGSVTLKEAAPPRIDGGRKLTLTGGASAWETMLAPIWRCEYAPAAGSTTLRFGPPGRATIHDFIERMREFRQRPTVEASYADRNEGKLRGGRPGSNTGYNKPQQIPTATAGGARNGFELEGQDVDGTKSARIWPGRLWWKATKLTVDRAADNGVRSTVPTIGGEALTTVKEAAAGTFYLKWETTPEGDVTAATIETSEPTHQDHDPDMGTSGTYFVEIGTVDADGKVYQKLRGDVWWDGVTLSLHPDDGSGSGSGGTPKTEFTEIYVMTQLDSVTSTCECSCDCGSGGGGSGYSGYSGSGGSCSCQCHVTVCGQMRLVKLPSAWLVGDPFQQCVSS